MLNACHTIKYWSITHIGISELEAIKVKCQGHSLKIHENEAKLEDACMKLMSSYQDILE